ncbi:FecCD family ABC transporter permease [Anaerosinus massiliensis]|uniref:FecCD family ABC transporter permease n=1 Tax=Massilibacillus massiliensis TaxID=1806837 RepID=UPI000AF5701C|nr:iron ABC transporter permease [Massilibacillus massiliensis]
MVQSDVINIPEEVSRKKCWFGIICIGLSVMLVVSIMLAVCFGSVKIELTAIFQIMLHKIFGMPLGSISMAHADIIWQLRLPRILMAAVVGAGLAMCGTVMQASVQNPLAEPYILGIASGASLGAVFSIMLGGSKLLLGLGITIWAFVGAILATVAVLFLAGLGGQMSTMRMVLAGAVISALFGAAANFLVYIANNAEGMRNVAFWTMGSLAGAKWDTLLLPLLGVSGAAVFFLLRYRKLNALLLGEEAAVTLGIQVIKERRINMVITAILTGIIVANCGIFGFVGLVIPHAVRCIVGADHRRLMPGVLLVGAIFLIWADVLSRVLLRSGDLPIGIITALIGAPFFMWLLFRRSFNFGGN